MADTKPGAYDAILKLLREGKVQEADELAQKLKAAETAAAVAAGAPAEPAQPRTPEEVLLDLFKCIHGLLGTSPAMVPLIAELEAVMPKPPAATS
jgi:hypothetical protein